MNRSVKMNYSRKCPKCNNVFKAEIKEDHQRGLMERFIICPKCRTKITIGAIVPFPNPKRRPWKRSWK